MTKDQMIKALEGRVIRTADGAIHTIENGAFYARSGAYVRLANLALFHVKWFYENSEEGERDQEG